MISKIDNMNAKYVQRYLWAIQIIKGKYPKKEHIRVLDIACGVGYGSWLMAEKEFHVHAVDRSQEAKDMFEQHWTHPNICFTLDNVMDFKPDKEGYDAIVSFESIEHLKDDYAFVEKIKNLASLWIISVPNENIVPYKSETKKWHYRHYTKEQMNKLLPTGKKSWFTQYHKATKYKMVPMHEDSKTLAVIWEREAVVNG